VEVRAFRIALVRIVEDSGSEGGLLMPILTKLREFLDSNGVPYEVVPHRQAFTAQEVAQAQHVPGKDLAKVVMLRSGAKFFMVVVPATTLVDLDLARAALGRRDLTLATEQEFAGLFPQCELGAMPPLGNLYDLPVYVDHSLTRDDSIVFNAGTHSQTVRMKYADFARLVQPKVAALAR
jgi:Ala-tRNA(Pro) deacylase